MMRRTAFAMVIAGLLPWAAPWATMLPGTLGLALLPAPGLAAEAPAAEAEGTTADRAAEVGLEHSEEHGAGEGMPQLNANTYASQILWLIITFAVLYYLLKTKALPRVADILEARQERISNDLDKAANLRAEAEAASEEYAKVVAEAQAKASAAIKAARDAAAADIARRTAALDKELGARIADAEKAVQASRAQALTELEDVAVEVAQAATQRLVGIEVTAAEAKAALAEIRKDVA
jgi:F-type H+-transporting ATPase subunit b